MTNETKHTPAPWFIGTEGDILYKPKGDIGNIQIVKRDGLYHYNKEANAQLIAAAPELLIAAEQALFGLKIRAKREPEHKGVAQDIDALEKAIAKAKGEA